VNALASGAITAKNESTPLPDKLVSLGYRITAADIGTKVVFLASSRERFITWILLKVDGGLDAD
jgi:NAD(P)-dependent dehydrogenase (short-subunit alcohol dehydrogenase family)